MDFYEKVGHNLLLFRKARRMTQGELSKKINKTVACISKYEHGQIAIDLETFCQYCDILNIEPADIIQNSLPHKNSHENKANTFFRKSPIYIYHYDKLRNIMHIDALEVFHKSNEARLHLYIKDYHDYTKANYLYEGKIEYHTPFTRLILRNVNDHADLIMITVYNMGNDLSYRIGQMDILSYYYQPITTKCILSKEPILDEAKQIELTRISRDEIKYLRDTNYFLVNNTNT